MGAWAQTLTALCRKIIGLYEPSLLRLNLGGGQIERSRFGKKRPFPASILFLACLFPRPFASQRGLHALLLAGLEVKGVAPNLLDNVFLLHLAFEPTQSVFEGFSLLQSNLGQTDTPPDSSGWTGYLLQGFKPKSSGTVNECNSQASFFSLIVRQCVDRHGPPPLPETPEKARWAITAGTGGPEKTADASRCRRE